MKTRVRPKGQITLPAEVRRHLRISEGDDVAFTLDPDGQVIITGLTTVPADQVWFWTDGWQAGEREASEQISAGETSGPLSEAEFLSALDSD